MRAKCQFPGISCDAATGRGLLAMQKYHGSSRLSLALA